MKLWQFVRKNSTNGDFTLKKYLDLCRTILDSGYQTATIADYMANPAAFDRVVVLRHDVDRWPRHAVYMAMIEYQLGIRSTYYFRTTRQVFRSDFIRLIGQQGHEIGYHYETLAACQGNYDAARQQFEQHLAALRAIQPIRTIAMHGSPLSPYDNRDLWQRYDYRHYNLLGEAYLDIDYRHIGYLTDTGRSWAAERRNRRDRPLETDALQLPTVRTTDEVRQLIAGQQYPRLLLQAHPERWAWSSGSFIRSFVADTVVNGVKVGLSLVR